MGFVVDMENATFSAVTVITPKMEFVKRTVVVM